MSPSASSSAGAGPVATASGIVSRGRGGAEVQVHVTPGASADAVVGLRADADGRPRLAVRVRAAADRGAANDAVLRLLAAAWQLPPSRLAIRRGHADRRKTVSIDGDAAALVRHLDAWAASRGADRVPGSAPGDVADHAAAPAPDHPPGRDAG